MPNQSIDTLETFPNPKSERDFTIRIDVPEFTSLCPKTGQPDFAKLEIEYIPDELCIELKSLKFYVLHYREQGGFHEAVTNQILDDLISVSSPRFMKLTAIFNPRGGIYTTVAVEHLKEGWSPRTDINIS